MEKIYLDEKWTLLTPDGKSLDAVVPGCVHTDLMANGIISDIFYRDNSKNIQWIENESWIYTTSFSLENTENAVLVFEGLDTYATIELNGTQIAVCDNMFIEHRVNIADTAVVGGNNLRVIFDSPVQHVKDKPKLTGAFTTERLHTRRMQCTYGWDWVDRFVTCGIFRPAYITYEQNFVCKDAYIFTQSIDSFGAFIKLFVEFSNYKQGGEVLFEVLSPCGCVVHKRSIYIDVAEFYYDFNIENPILWDVSNNENPLYTLKITTPDDVFETAFGVRTVRILQTADKKDSNSYKLCKKLQDTPSGKIYDKNTEFSSFEVVLNGRKVMCMGANWVPCEPFPSAESDEKITEILTLAKECGMNIIRVWGGGIPEKEHFYRECDRLGLMVVQDFMMACGQYPEKEADFIASLNKEADYITRKLRNHPSIVWWNGDNENAIDGTDVDTDYQGRASAIYGIMPYIRKNDFSRTFLSSSPWGGNVNASKTVGTTHNTQFLGSLFEYINNTDSFQNYKQDLKEYTARFISEEPCFGAISLESLKKFMTDEDIYNTSDMWLYHTKGNPGLNDELFNYFTAFAEGLFGKFQDGEDRLFKYQYLQYEWIRVSLENARRNRGFTGGIIYWMLNDCWPSASGWSIIDYYNMPKAAYYAFRNGAKPVMLSIDEDADETKLYLCNNTDDTVSLEISYEYIDYVSGKVDKSKQIDLSASAQSVVCIPIEAPAENQIIFAESGDILCFYKKGGCQIKKCTAPQIIARSKDSVTLKSTQYIHAVELCNVIKPADNFFAMKPNKEYTIYFEHGDNVTVNAYTLI